MRQQQRLAAVLASALLAALPSSGRADAPQRGVALAEQARAVLRRHCLRCHGATRRGGLHLLEGPLSGPARQLVVPGAPDRSLLLDLVDGGSMPPGALPKVPVAQRDVLRAWVRSGAAAFPAESGRAYLLRQLVEDFGKLPESSKPHVRYVSLDHLGPDKAKRQSVAAVLRAVLRHLSAAGKPPIELAAVEPSGGLLRLDVRQGGWDRKPFKNEGWNLFDLLLLEYPYGVTPQGAWTAEQAAFLRRTRPVRPILYVRGDWLARVAVSEPLYSDLVEALGKAEEGPPPREAKAALPGERVGMEEAVRELETNPEVGKLSEVLRGIPALAGMSRKERVTRDVWERHYQEVVRRLGVDGPIVPVDGLSWPNQDGDAELKVRFRLIDPKGPENDPPAKTRFVAGTDRYSLWIQSNKDVVIELVYTDAKGKRFLVGKKSHPVLAGEPLLFSGKDGKGFRVLADREAKHVQESVSFTLYARRSEAPLGKVLKGESIADRFLHPLYEWAENGKGHKSFDASKWVKITVPVTFVKP